MPSLSSMPQKITVTGADLSDEGVLIRFSDGETVLFHSEFLYDVRDQDANILVGKSEDD